MASISFPSSPSNGDTYSYDGLTYQYNSTKNKWSVVATTTIDGVSADAIDQNLVPSANVTHDLGTSDKAFRDLYLSGSSINLGDATISSSGSAVTLPAGSTVGGVTIGTGSGGATQYANTSLLPTSGLTAGEFAFVGNTLFMTNGSGWYSVALVNQSPELTLSTSSISLGSTGNTIDFTFTATDPDGDSLTMTATTTANSAQANVTLYTSNNTVTVENLSADGYSANIIVTASDGINQTFRTATLTVSYLSELWEETVLSIGTSSTNGLDNSTFVDRSTNALTVTPSGTPTQTAFHPYLDNWSVFTDGANDTTTDQIHTSDSFINMGTGDFTIELWCQSYVNADRDGLFTFKSSSTAYNFMFRNATTAEVWELYHSIGSAVTVTYANSANPLNEWVHHAFVRSSGTLVWYINGVAKQTIANHAEDFDDVDIVQVGRYSAGRWPGWISNFRVIKGDAIYTSNFTVPTEPLSVTDNTILLLNSSNSFKNRGSLTTTIETSGTIGPQISAFNPFGPGFEYAVGENKGSAYIPSNSYISIAHDSTQSLGNNNWTIEWWMNPLTSVSNDEVLIDKGWGGSSYGEFLIYNKGSNYLFYTSSTGSTWNILSQFNTGWVQWTNEWKHCAVVRNGSQIAFFLNGELTAASTNAGSATLVNTGDPITLCSDNNGSKGYPSNYISDFKWAVGTVAYDASLSSVGDQVFTPPTSPVGNTNASLYLPMDNAGIFDKTGNHTLELVGGTVTSTTKTKYATTSMRVASATDYLVTSGLEIGHSEDLTIEGWFNFDFTNSNVYMAGHNTTYAGNNNMYQLGLASGRVGWWIGGSLPSTQYDPSALSTNTWYHLAWVKNGTSYKIYKDGSQVASFTNSAIIQSHEWRIGNTFDGASQGMTGYIEDFQILKGVAKYTANFTPPTATQGRNNQAES